MMVVARSRSGRYHHGSVAETGVALTATAIKAAKGRERPYKLAVSAGFSAHIPGWQPLPADEAHQQRASP